jgi:drug/metabolite transporter (DMT)-like permease
MPPRSDRLRIALAFGALYVIWGSTFVAMGCVVRDGIPPFLATGARLLLSGGILLAWGVARGAGRIPTRVIGDLALAGALMFVGGSALSMYAVRTVDTGLVALIAATTPFWMALASARSVSGERLSASGSVGIGIGFVGLAVAIGPQLAGDGPGIAAAVLSPVSWVAGSVWTRDRLGDIPATTIAGYQMLFGASLSIAVGLAHGELAQLAPTVEAAGALGYLAVFGSVLGYTSFVFLMARVSAAKVSTYAYVNPVVAIALGWWIAGERLAPHVLAGAGVVVMGVVLVNTARVRIAPVRRST